jgi:hypothetical protein
LLNGDALDKHCENELRLHHGNVIADADVRPGITGEIGVARELGLVLWR